MLNDDGRLLANGKRHVSKIWVFDPDNTKAIRRESNARFSRKLALQLPHTDEGEERGLEVDTKWSTVVPSKNFCPTTFWDFSSLGLDFCERPRQTNFSHDNGSKRGISGTLTIVMMERQVATLNDSVNFSEFDAY
jgi:hypothetical protein